AGGEGVRVWKGAWGVAVGSRRNRELGGGARLGSPLVIGVGDGEQFLASDPGALLGQTSDVAYLRDGQIGVITPDEWHLLDAERARVEASVERIDWETGDADRGSFEHYMLKEQYEQPDGLENA